MIGSRSMIDRDIERVPDPDIPKESEAMCLLLDDAGVEESVVTEACKIVEQLADEVVAEREGRQEAEREAARMRVLLNFDDLRRANVLRCEEVFHLINDWSPTDWATAMAGECGEACNEVKKLRRLDGADSSIDTPEERERLREVIGKEIADLVIYADLLAARLDIDLAGAIIEKFNEVSAKRGSSITL
jgi:NTP pyrophosphatase (non-canonical NTP hydrolase)